jgi:hypothetical protein
MLDAGALTVKPSEINCFEALLNCLGRKRQIRHVLADIRSFGGRLLL